MCLSDIDYCIDYSYDSWDVYDDSYQIYQRTQSHSSKINQTGADSSNSIVEYWVDYYHEYYFINGIPCSITELDTVACLVCDDGNVYCYEEGVPPLPSNPFFANGHEALSLQ